MMEKIKYIDPFLGEIELELVESIPSSYGSGCFCLYKWVYENKTLFFTRHEHITGKEEINYLHPDKIELIKKHC